MSNHGLLAEAVVLDRLNLHPGDTVRLGNASFTVRGALLTEPDRVAAPLILGPRVLIAADALASTGLIAPGSMVQYALRATLPDPAAALAALRNAFPDQGWRIRDPHDAAPGVARFIDQTSLFMTLVGLTSLLVGGIGVANGVRAWLDARARTIATLRCLGRFRRPGAGSLPDPGPGARPLRHRHRACGWRFGADRAGRLAPGRAAGAAGTRPLSRPAPARRVLRPADGAGVFAVATWARGAHPRRGAVPRRADPRANPPVTSPDCRQRRRRCPA